MPFRPSGDFSSAVAWASAAGGLGPRSSPKRGLPLQGADQDFLNWKHAPSTRTAGAAFKKAAGAARVQAGQAGIKSGPKDVRAPGIRGSHCPIRSLELRPVVPLQIFDGHPTDGWQLGNLRLGLGCFLRLFRR